MTARVAFTNARIVDPDSGFDGTGALLVEAGKIVGAVAKLVGGGGGGRPHMATAGGKDVAKLDEALAKTKSIVESFLHQS